jgi:flagellar hook-basal body complex protein FliE
MIQQLEHFPIRIEQPKGFIKNDLRPDSGSDAFGENLQQVISELRQSQQKTDSAVRSVLLGNTGDIPTAIVSMEETSMKFQMMLEVRNRLVDTYQEISRMQI